MLILYTVVSVFSVYITYILYRQLEEENHIRDSFNRAIKLESQHPWSVWVGDAGSPDRNKLGRRGAVSEMNEQQGEGEFLVTLENKGIEKEEKQEE